MTDSTETAAEAAAAAAITDSMGTIMATATCEIKRLPWTKIKEGKSNLDLQVPI